MTVIDINKVAYAWFYYVNQWGHTYRKPIVSVHGIEIQEPDGYALYHHDYPLETNLERAKRLDILDTWTPIVWFKFTTTRKIAFSGDRALSLWATYRAKIFGS
jgi:hypothetical protein